MLATHVDTRTGERWLKVTVVDSQGRGTDYADALDHLSETSWVHRHRWCYLSWSDRGNSDGSRFLEAVGLNEAAVVERGRTVRVPRRPAGCPVSSDAYADPLTDPRNPHNAPRTRVKASAAVPDLTDVRRLLTSTRPFERKKGRRALAAWLRGNGLEVRPGEGWYAAVDAVCNGVSPLAQVTV